MSYHYKYKTCKRSRLCERLSVPGTLMDPHAWQHVLTWKLQLLKLSQTSRLPAGGCYTLAALLTFEFAAFEGCP